VLLAKLPPFFIYRPATNSHRFAKKNPASIFGRACIQKWKKRLEIAKIRYLTRPTSGKRLTSTSMDAARTPSVAVEYEVPGPARTLSTAVDAAMVDEEQPEPPANGRTPSVMPGRTLSGI
jgi:hypothetical protein